MTYIKRTHMTLYNVTIADCSLCITKSVSISVVRNSTSSAEIESVFHKVVEIVPTSVFYFNNVMYGAVV